MNNIKLIFITLLLLWPIQQKTQELEITIENLSKIWVLHDVINEEKTEEELSEIKEMLEGSSLQLNRDMTFTFSFMLDLSGSWTLNNAVITTEDKKGKNTWTVHNLAKDTEILSRNNSKQKLVYKSK